MDEQGYKENARTYAAKWRKRENSDDRLKAFREATLYAADFICMSCHQRNFQTNVHHFNAKFQDDLLRNTEIKLEDYIEEDILSGIHLSKSLSNKKDEDTKYVCKTCINYIKTGKLPPSSVKNGLKLTNTDEMLEDEDLMLTELEASLVAKTIMFQKIFFDAK